MLYNPLEQVTKSSFREHVESGYVDFVLQRLEWTDGKHRYEVFGWEDCLHWVLIPCRRFF